MTNPSAAPQIGEPPPPADDELYDGPIPEETNVVRPPLFAAHQPLEPAAPEVPAVNVRESGAYLAKLLSLWDVIAARAVCMIAAIGGLGIWAAAVLYPDMMRVIAAAGYSVCVFVPSVLLALKKG